MKIYRINEFSWIREYEIVEKYWNQLLIKHCEKRKEENGKEKMIYKYELIDERDINSWFSEFYTDKEKLEKEMKLILLKLEEEIENIKKDFNFYLIKDIVEYRQAKS